MPLSRKALRARLKSVTSTRKITRAMELVAAAKMRKAVQTAVRSRPYARGIAAALAQAWTRMGESAAHHPLVHARPGAHTTLLLVFSADRGLCGGYNTNIVRAVLAARVTIGEGDVACVAVGKKAADALTRAGMDVVARFPVPSSHVQAKDVRPIVRFVVDAFLAGEYAAVEMVTTHFVSAVAQSAVRVPLLPLAQPLSAASPAAPMRTEPSAQVLLTAIAPHVVQTAVLQACAEAIASEHASRMVAMKNAGDAAADMADDVRTTLNQARQAAITQEIAEINSGTRALRGAR